MTEKNQAIEFTIFSLWMAASSAITALVLNSIGVEFSVTAVVATIVAATFLYRLAHAVLSKLLKG